MADFSNIIQKTIDVIHDNEQGEITSQKLRELVLDIIDDVNRKKLDNIYEKDGDNYYITIGDKTFSIEPYHQIQVVYSDINISSFSYQDISDLGGTSTPIITYSQTKTTYIDGQISNTETITSGATKSFSANSIQNATLNTSTGVVTCNQVNTGDRRSIGNIRVTVSMNGKTATRDANVYQAAYVERIPDYYIGQAQNRVSFLEYDDEQILGNSTGYTLQLNPIFPNSNTYQQFTGTNKLMYVLIKDTLNVSNIKVDINNPGETFDLKDQIFTDVFTYKNDITTQDGQYKVYWVYDSEYTTENGFRIKFNQ